MRVLHLVRRPQDGTLTDILEEQSRAHEVTVVLLHAGDATREDFPGRVLALHEGGPEEGPRGGIRQIGYGELLDLILDHDRVFCW